MWLLKRSSKQMGTAGKRSPETFRLCRDAYRISGNCETRRIEQVRRTLTASFVDPA